MFTPRRRRGALIRLSSRCEGPLRTSAHRSFASWAFASWASAVHPLDLGDHRLVAQLGDDGIEVLEVVDLEIDGDRGEVRRPPAHADVVDVAVVLGDHPCDLRE